MEGASDQPFSYQKYYFKLFKDNKHNDIYTLFYGLVYGIQGFRETLEILLLLSSFVREHTAVFSVNVWGHFKFVLLHY